MKVLVLNCGSSSIKYQFFNTANGQALARGSVERIGMAGAILTHIRHDGDKVKIAGEIVDHQAGVEFILAILLSANHGVIKDRAEIEAVGHRIVHGGEKFTDSVLITDDVMDGVQECIELAPLHNPHNIKGIKACQRLLSDVPQVGVFDTAFHHAIPDYAYYYGLPRVLYKRYGVRRYGFHGASHFYVSHRAAQFLRKPIEELNLITCHLGNGCSMAAVRSGLSVDTTMGFTPVEGLLMGTRCGDVDPAAILYIMGREELSLEETNAMLNKHSGMIGLSGVSSDMREIIQEMSQGNKRAKLAFDVFCYRVKKYIGAYTFAMGRLDAIVFTGGIGENAAPVRAASLEGLEALGLLLDASANERQSSEERAIQAPQSKVALLVIPTNEELVIAQDTDRIVKETKDHEV